MSEAKRVRSASPSRELSESARVSECENAHKTRKPRLSAKPNVIPFAWLFGLRTNIVHIIFCFMRKP